MWVYHVSLQVQLMLEDLRGNLDEENANSHLVMISRIMLLYWEQIAQPSQNNLLAILVLASVHELPLQAILGICANNITAKMHASRIDISAGIIRQFQPRQSTQYVLHRITHAMIWFIANAMCWPRTTNQKTTKPSSTDQPELALSFLSRLSCSLTSSPSPSPESNRTFFAYSSWSCLKASQYSHLALP